VATFDKAILAGIQEMGIFVAIGGDFFAAARQMVFIGIVVDSQPATSISFEQVDELPRKCGSWPGRAGLEG